MLRNLFLVALPAIALVTTVGFSQNRRSFQPAPQAQPSGWREETDEGEEDQPFEHYILMRQSGRNGVSVRRVAEDREFRSGERFKIAIASRRSGYLYVICQGSQGENRLLFPYRNSVANRIAADRQVTVPGQDWYRFDNEPGEENLFLVFSPKRITELDRAAKEDGEIDPRFLRRLNDRSKDIVVDDQDNPNRVYMRHVTLQHHGE